MRPFPTCRMRQVEQQEDQLAAENRSATFDQSTTFHHASM
jgi:hypothetical protein